MIRFDETLCANCGVRIYHSTFRQTPGARPEPSYDPNNDPVTWRHVGGYAACMGGWAKPRPPIITLCGSTRFRDAFEKATRDLGKMGYIILTVACFGHLGELEPEECEIGNDVKDALDALHKSKIDISDEILVLNVGGYIGDSTRSEIAHAEQNGKPVNYLESVAM